MKTSKLFVALASILSVGVLWQFTAHAQTRPSGVNLAMVAKASSSYVSGDTSLTAMNDGYDPRNSRDRRRGAYGNWPQRNSQWIQYEWSQPISTNRIDVYWWADGQGVNLPKECRLKYWDGKDFAAAPNAQGLGTAASQYNTTTFDEIQTTKLRLEIDAAGTFSTGVLEWKVYDTGKSPKFPPVLNAGVDRVAVLGAKTFLNATVKSLQPDTATAVTWSKNSGPGEVKFDDAGAATTAANFSAPGQYVLKISANENGMSSSSTVNVKVEEPAPAASLHPIYASHYKVDSPLWNARLKSLIVNWIPHCYERISDPNLREGGIANFVEAANKLAGREFKPHVGYPFSNAWVYNTIEAMADALAVDPQGDQEIMAAQDKMRAKLDEWIPIILAAQEPDGYLQTRFTLGTARDRGPVQHWDPRTRGEHEGYVAGYFIEAAMAHHRITGGKDTRLYDAAKKLADCWDNNIGPPPKKSWYDGHQEMEQALSRFGHYVNSVDGAGKGDRYIKLAKFLLDSRYSPEHHEEYDQSHVPVVQQYEAVGHAVRAAYTYSGMAAVAMNTHELLYESATRSLWDNIVNKKYYVTGGIGSGETSEGFGPNYSLRNNAYCESCSNCGLLFFQHQMHLMDHDAKYVDLYEDTIYNAILGDTDLAGKNFYYQNPLDQSNARYPWHNCPCCVGNIPRVLLMLPTWMYSRSDDAINVNLFAGTTVTIPQVSGTDVELVQATDYPWNGRVSITVNPAAAGKSFKINLRSPNRNASSLYTSTPSADGIVSLTVNGSPVQAKPNQDGYIVIDRAWSAGDKIEFELPMKPQRIKASEKIAADVGRVALRYGPLIYNIEQVDQSLDNNNAVLNPESSLTSEWKPDLLGGVTVIKGTFANGSPMMAIPNYARNNRGGRSMVWIKDQ